MDKKPMTKCLLDENGHEIGDPKPVAIPSGFTRPETLAEQVQRLVRTTVSQAAEDHGYESWEEANDFDIEDDPIDAATPFETYFDPVLGRELTPEEVLRDQVELGKEAEKRLNQMQAPPGEPSSFDAPTSASPNPDPASDQATTGDPAPTVPPS